MTIGNEEQKALRTASVKHSSNNMELKNLMEDIQAHYQFNLTSEELQNGHRLCTHS